MSEKCEHVYEYQQYFAGDDTCIHCGETETWVTLQEANKRIAELKQENARLRDSIKGYMEAKERQWPTKEFSLALGPKRELDKLLNGEV